jgi:hypothetical protein
MLHMLLDNGYVLELLGEFSAVAIKSFGGGEPDEDVVEEIGPTRVDFALRPMSLHEAATEALLHLDTLADRGQLPPELMVARTKLALGLSMVEQVVVGGASLDKKAAQFMLNQQQLPRSLTFSNGTLEYGACGRPARSRKDVVS